MSDSSDTSDEKRRPNANYKLSKERAEEEGMVFHYNRESRLAKSPQAVRDLYAEKPAQRRFGLLGPLVGSKPRMMMFFSIVILCIMILIITGLGLASSSYTIDGNEVTVQAVKYEGATIVVLKKTPAKSALIRFSATPYTGAVDIAIQPSARTETAQGGELENVFYHRVFFTLEPTEIYRFSIPFDSDELACVLKTEKKMVQMMIKAE